VDCFELVGVGVDSVGDLVVGMLVVLICCCECLIFGLGLLVRCFRI